MDNKLKGFYTYIMDWIVAYFKTGNFKCNFAEEHYTHTHTYIYIYMYADPNGVKTIIGNMSSLSLALTNLRSQWNISKISGTNELT